MGLSVGQAIAAIFQGFYPMGSNPAIQYVAPNGNDSASGADWTNAKLTILGAYDALPATYGGYIYVAAGSYIGGEVAYQGLWIAGPGDPTYNALLPGWRQQKSVRIIGIGQWSNMQFSIGVPVNVLGGQPGQGWLNDATKPAMWFAGTNTNFMFENLSLSPPAVGIRIGVSADNTNRNMSDAGIWFRNVAVTVSGNGGGPVIDLGYCFWIYFDDCVCRCAFNDISHNPLPLTSDKRAAILVNPGTSTTSLFTVRNCRFSLGGLIYYGGGTGGGPILVEDVVLEGDFTNPVPPIVWIKNLNPSQEAIVIRGVQFADNGPGSMPTVQLDIPANLKTAVTCIGVQGSIQGPCTILGNTGAAPTPITPLRKGQVGSVGYGLIGQHDSARRNFGLSAARFTNLIVQDSTTWPTPVGGTGGAITTGQAAPDGTTGAALIQAASGTTRSAVYSQNRTFAVGDIVIFGTWIRGSSAAGLLGNNTISFGVSTTGFTFVTLDGTVTTLSATPLYVVPSFSGDGGEWAWIVQVVKFSVIGTNPVNTFVRLAADSTHPAVFYAPIFLHIPAGTISDNEAAELMTHAQSWSDAAVVGQISPLKGQVINAIGGLATRIKAGAPVDADYATPVDGLIVTDTTNNKIWTRIGGVWKGAVVS